jgi:hypothetical protein
VLRDSGWPGLIVDPFPDSGCLVLRAGCLQAGVSSLLGPTRALALLLLPPLSFSALSSRAKDILERVARRLGRHG